MELKIHPSVGVARLGNSPEQFYLAPDVIGGLPYEADANGNPKGPVINFKDEAGRVRRQGQSFKVYQSDGTELTLDSPNVESIEWTVHLANKKAAWYQYSELEGNLLYGSDNSYTKRDVKFRNPSKEGEEARQSLIIDPGPRTVSGADQSVAFDIESAPCGYPVQFPNADVKYGISVTTLGDLMTDDSGRLVVLGGKGNAGGDEPLTSYGGSDTWHDDISDGPVYCKVTLKDGSSFESNAWVIVGSPDYAPEIVNISTLSDSMFDVGVRYFDLVPDLFSGGAFKPSFKANFQRDILPIIQRLGRYQWVANVQSMSAFSSNVFDFADNSDANKANRQNYLAYFREPNDKNNPVANEPQSQLFRESDGGFFPKVPLNSGSNSVSNTTIVKFLSLNDTQQFLMTQWAEGNFESNPDYTPYPVDEKDAASVGNCVGLPMCPGIEVTWSVQNPAIYADSYRISDQRGKGGYDQSGLTPSRDECEGGGCEPGDLTKRMACPWQADFFQCTIQPINFTDPNDNRKAPTFYSYWWPPQSPWDVLIGEFSEEGQKGSHLPSGQQMNYARGINSFVQMVEHWAALAFIRDRNAGDEGFPFFTETERNNELFTFDDLEVGKVSGNPDDDETVIPVFYIEQKTQKIMAKGARAEAMVQFLEERAFKPIAVAEEGLGLPRSGTRQRR
ncbi:UNVERIFIED_CONTAM: hypothetical protein GTU68_059672 [Idotea baltica]|nr:hypothetical protein [Idotea baltica]